MKLRINLAALFVLLPVAGLIGVADSARGATFPADELTPKYEQAAQYILGKLKTPAKGYCLVFGAGRGRLACELAGRSDLKIIGAEPDGQEVRSGRNALHKADLYGNKITLHEQSLEKLDYRDYAAALVVSDSIIAEGKCGGSAAEMFRMVRPHGGVAVLGQPPGCPNKLNRGDLEKWLGAAGLSYTITEDGDGLWARIERGPLPGAGQWTHVRADIANTACSGDARTRDRFKVLWFGEPGPAVMVDRHWRNTAPLYKGGRLIIPAKDRIICSDAYNGARLWELDVPNSSRIAMMRDAGWLVLADDCLYAAAENNCLKIDLAGGKITDTFHPPEQNMDWGYLGVQGDRLYGSQQIHKASYLASYIGRGREGNQLGRGDHRLIITSKALFCCDRHTGKLFWTYTPDAAVIANVTICVGGGGVYFFESSAPKAVADGVGRASLSDFTEGAGEFLVKLDNGDGKLLWRHQRDMPVHNVLHACYANDIVLACGCSTGSDDFWYHLRAYRAGDGSPAWEKDLATGFGIGDKNHGKQDKHPMIIGQAVYLKQGSFDLATGKPLGFSFKTSNCAECSASMNHIFGRMGGVASIWSLHGDGSHRPLNSTVRPGCYTTIIPAGGIITMPAFSAGCTCDHTIQTTIGWLPE